MAIKTETLLPFQIIEIQNFSPNDVNFLQDDPYNPDGNSIFTTSAATNPIMTLRFEPPDGDFIETQTILVRMTDPSFIGLHIEVYEDGQLRFTSPTKYGDSVLEFPFNASVLTDETGEKARIKLVAHTFIGLTIESVSAVNWKATTYEEIISPFSGGGYNAVPYNQQLYNGAGVVIGRIKMIINSDVQAKSVRGVIGTAFLNVDSDISVLAKPKRSFAAELDSDSTLDAVGIRQRTESAILRIDSNLSVESEKIAGGIATLDVDSTMNTTAFRTVFNKSLLTIDLLINTRAVRRMSNSALLETSSELTSMSVNRISAAALLEIDSIIVVLFGVERKASAHIKTDSTLIAVQFIFRWNEDVPAPTNWNDQTLTETNWKDSSIPNTEWKGVVK